MPSLESPAPIHQAASLPTQERLYISPFDHQILRTVLPSTSPDDSKAASYQTIQTFPEKSYGYISVDSPVAQALKKKYHGAFLKGSKMRVEEARPEKKRKRVDQSEDVVEESKKSRKRDKKHAKLDEALLPAVELPEGRHVKRGWTDSAKSKGDSKKHKSKREAVSNDKGQLAFRTQVPDKTPKSRGVDGANSTSSKSKKKAELIEFDKTTQFPSFLKQSAVDGDGRGTTFEEDRGWVDQDGKVVEAISSRNTRREHKEVDEAVAGLDGVNTSKSKRSDFNAEAEHAHSGSESEASSALSSSSASSGPSGDVHREGSIPSPTSTIKATKSRLSSLKAGLPIPGADLGSPLLPSTEAATPTSAVPPTNDSITNGSLPVEEPKEVHPLEALFKRPAAPPASSTSTSNGKPQRRPAPAPIDTSFGFGFDLDNEEAGSDNDSSEVRMNEAPPQTPFTQRDRFNRSIRSAAPTPDTAAIGRRFSWREVGGREDDDDEDEDGDDAQAEQAASSVRKSRENVAAPDEEQETAAGTQEEVADGKPEQNDFEKHFYAHRGEYNKAWKARRREARKEIRQAENRKVGVGR